MNVSSECVDNFHHYNQLELLLLILVCIHMSCFVYFGENVVPIGNGNSFRLVLESHGKVIENDFSKRVVTLTYEICTHDSRLSCWTALETYYPKKQWETNVLIVCDFWIWTTSNTFECNWKAVQSKVIMQRNIKEYRIKIQPFFVLKVPLSLNQPTWAIWVILKWRG